VELITHRTERKVPGGTEIIEIDSIVEDGVILRTVVDKWIQ
jgi:hypothetical protein